MIDDGRFMFSYYHYKKSFRFLNHCRKISVPSLSIIFEGLALSSGPLRKQKFTSIGSKGHWWIWIRFVCVRCFWTSLRASSPGRSGGGAGKGRKACNYVSGIWISASKSRCEMLIGRDDISNVVITLDACFSTFAYIRADWRKSDHSVDGSNREIGSGI